MKYDANYFIDKFSKIPDELWGVGTLSMGNVHCALGHCDHNYYPLDNRANAETRAIYELFKSSGSSVEGINDGWGTDKYRQATPKERILAALYDIKKAQEPEIKEIIRYVVVDTPIRKEAKQLLTEKTN